MRRFVLTQNILHYQKLLAKETNKNIRDMVRNLLLSEQRQLAYFDAASLGVRSPTAQVSLCRFHSDPFITRRFRSDFDVSPHPLVIIDPRPCLHIIDINDAYACATMSSREALVGKPLFDAFPDNPNDSAADGVSNVYTSLLIAAETGRISEQPLQRYDVRDPEGHFIERHWRIETTPVVDSEGRLAYLLIHARDLTDEVNSRLTPSAGHDDSGLANIG